MRKGILYSLVAGMAGIGFIGISIWNQETKEYYQPRVSSNITEDSYKDAAEWLHQRRANQITGVVDPNDVLAARQAAENFSKKGKTSALNFVQSMT